MKIWQMKSLSNQLANLTLAAIAVVSSNIAFVPASQALTAATSFVCSTSNGKPATVARTKKGDVAIVVWSSEEFSGSGFNPQTRCQQVSARFQSMYRSGQLKYITTGTINNLPVVCATKQIKGTCDRQNLLYTLKPNADPKQTISKLMAIRNRASSSSIEESGRSPSTSEAQNTSIEIDWLEEN
ncbi:COP23 domain-containing protein [Chamaesiphon sp. VAR_48_metabat_403]|uniref:COP23 domain-containing protein n=1 Tax=Chamaesiphon sp. VAR_48_metabat_403 TaxID=2964700 RepID=UPI00286DB9D9|nr:COP23 domain-containing protein [Chamaesiphon sp. VAR_48_metabat_403]